MAKNTKWHDDYWLLVMQLYLRKPVGVKPLYSREAVDLALELHVPPQSLFARQCAIASLQTPRIERIWQDYGQNPRRLSRAVRLLRQMKGFGSGGDFYEGVDVQETFERDFRPLAEDERLTPVTLVLILDLYFRLTPITMVSETPEVQELARLVKVPVGLVVDVMDIYQRLDPYLNRNDVLFDDLALPCQQVWQRYGTWELERLASLARELQEYFK